MKTKAISTVIASILMLMIVIALGGTAYLYVSGTFTSKTAISFEIIDSVNDTVVIRNSGTEQITRITATLDDNPENIAVVPNIDGLVAYWSFNEGSGSTTDDNSDNNNVGTLQPACGDCLSWGNGRFNSALKFDGDGGYVNIIDSPSLDLGSDMTILAWLKPVNAGTLQHTLGKRLGCGGPGIRYMLVLSEGKLVFASAPGSQVLSISTLKSDVWTLVAATVKLIGPVNAQVKLYINGNFDNQGDVVLDPPNNAPLRIGTAGNCPPPQNFKGIIDEVSMYNKVLSESEIKQLYSGLIPSGQLAKVKPLTPLSKGTHTLRLCTSSMCNTAILTII